MAVHLKPCHGCPIPKKIGDERCTAKRAEMRKKVSGLGLTSATFKCGILEEHLRPGRRITINTPILIDGGGYFGDGYTVSSVEVSATILSCRNGRFQCVVDLEAMREAQSLDESETGKDPKDLIYRKPRLPGRIVRFLDEPLRPLCAGGNLAGAGGKCDRPGCFDCSPPDFGGDI